jgi:hypothetical protein
LEVLRGTAWSNRVFVHADFVFVPFRKRRFAMLHRVLHLLAVQKFLFRPRKEAKGRSVFGPLRYLLLLVVLGWGLATTPARADFVMTTNLENEIKFFNSDANSSTSSFTGTVGSQHVDAKTVATVSVTTSTDVQTGAGFATIMPTSTTSNLTSLTFTPSDKTLFGDFSFRGQFTGTGTVSVTVVNQNGVSETPVTFTVSMANADLGPFHIISTDGDTIQSVTITANVTSDPVNGQTGFEEVKQVEFSTEVSVVPEPASLTIFGMGALGLAGYGWRRNRRLKG